MQNNRSWNQYRWTLLSIYEIILRLLFQIIVNLHTFKHNVNWVVMIFLMSYLNEFIWKNENENLWLCLSSIICIVEDVEMSIEQAIVLILMVKR